MNAKIQAANILWEEIERTWGNKITKRIIKPLEDAGFTVYYERKDSLKINIWGNGIPYDDRLNIYISTTFNDDENYIYHKIAENLLILDESDCQENREFEQQFIPELEKIEQQILELQEKARALKPAFVPKSATIRRQPVFWKGFSYETQGKFPAIWPMWRWGK